MTTFEKPRDVVGGLLVVAIGGLFLLFGRELEVGTSFRMGPGYFPTILSWLMVAWARRWPAWPGARRTRRARSARCRGAAWCWSWAPRCSSG